MNQTIGFIGVGNMGSALVKGLLKSDFAKDEDISVYDVDMEKVSKLVDKTGIKISGNNKELVEYSDIIILAVKPNIIEQVLFPLKNFINNDKLIVSIAAGVTTGRIAEIIGQDKKIVRTMPNTPAMVGEGMTVVSFNGNINEREKELIVRLFSSTGRVEVIKEELMSEVIAVSGSSPAYVFIMLEAMADAAVKWGIARDMAYRLAAQSVLGSAKMLLETKKHPGELKDLVCSPAGTTIEAVAALEREGFRNAIIQAMDCCTKKAREIGKQDEKC